MDILGELTYATTYFKAKMNRLLKIEMQVGVRELKSNSKGITK